ncbi:MAG: hypothetical protein MAG794_00900 [Gammaproteobacteria bacterium]|nr:hypothetical protein [Gammaproteobacteria bacterium]
MAPDGISVVEVKLDLPNTYYYLFWRPVIQLSRVKDRAARLEAVRGASKELGWEVFAAGYDLGAVRLLFGTTTDNLEDGLSALLENVHYHRLYLVQPNVALPRIVCYIHDRNNPGGQLATARNGKDRTVLPEIHFGIFMGERPWAEKMFGLLTSCSAELVPQSHRRDSLGEIAGMHSSKRGAIAEAYRSGSFSLKDIAEYFSMHFSEVSAVINGSGADY